MENIRNRLTRNMSTGKRILLIAAAIVIAVVVLKVLLTIVSIILSVLTTLAILALVAVVIYFLARSVWPRRTSP
jgi:hypothetical protein